MQNFENIKVGQRMTLIKGGGPAAFVTVDEVTKTLIKANGVSYFKNNDLYSVGRTGNAWALDSATRIRETTLSDGEAIQNRADGIKARKVWEQIKEVRIKGTEPNALEVLTAIKTMLDQLKIK